MGHQKSHELSHSSSLLCVFHPLWQSTLFCYGVCFTTKKPAPAKRRQETEGLSLGFAASIGVGDKENNTHFYYYTPVF